MPDTQMGSPHSPQPLYDQAFGLSTTVHYSLTLWIILLISPKGNKIDATKLREKGIDTRYAVRIAKSVYSMDS